VGFGAATPPFVRGRRSGAPRQPTLCCAQSTPAAVSPPRGEVFVLALHPPRVLAPGSRLAIDHIGGARPSVTELLVAENTSLRNGTPRSGRRGPRGRVGWARSSPPPPRPKRPDALFDVRRRGIRQAIQHITDARRRPSFSTDHWPSGPTTGICACRLPIGASSLQTSACLASTTFTARPAK